MDLKPVLLISVTILGMWYALLGALKLTLAERLRIEEDRVGGLVAAFGFMVGPVILVCGFVTDAVGRKGVWIAGALLIILSLLTLARATRYAWTLVAVLLLGGGWSAMVNVSNVLMEQAFHENLVAGANFVDFFFGLGAFLTPAVVAWLLRSLNYSRSVSLLACLAVIPLILIAFVDLTPTAASTETEAAPDAGATEGGLAEMLADPVLWLCCATMLFYAPLESSVGAWATTLVTAQKTEGISEDADRRTASLCLSGYWLCFMGSRLVAAMTASPGIEHSLGVVLAVIGTGGLIGIVLSRRRGWTIPLILLLGLVFGPVFPTLMAILLTHFSDEVAGRAVGFFFCSASIGWTVIPMLIGLVASRTHIRRGFTVAVASGVVFLVLTIVHYQFAQGN